MNQGKLEWVKKEMARVNIDSLGISELKWTGMGEFISDGNYIYYCGQKALRRNRVILKSTKESEVQFLGAISKTELISVCFQSKPFNITAIQVYVPTTKVEEAEVEWFHEDLRASLVAQRLKCLPGMRETWV